MRRWVLIVSVLLNMLCSSVMAWTATPSAYVHSLTQDLTGYLWVGTRDGIFRYNGHEWQKFHTESDVYRLPDNWADKLFADSSGRVWVGLHQAGLLCLNVDYTVTRWLEDRTVKAITQHAQSKHLYVGTNTEIWIRESEQEKFRELVQIPAIEDLITNHDSLYIATTAGFYRFLQKQNKLHKITDDFARAFWLDIKRSALWVATQQGVLRYDLATGRYTRLHKNLSVRALATVPDNLDVFWLGTEDGQILQLSAETFTFQPHTFKRIEQSRIDTLWQDTSGVLWIGARTGIEKVTRHFFDVRLLPETKQGRLVATLNEQDALWLGIEHQTLAQLSRDADKPRFLDWTHAAVAQKRPTSAVIQANKLFYGTFQGLLKFDLDKKTVEPINSANSGLSHDVVLFLDRLRDGRLLIGTDAGGLNIYDEAKATFQHISRETHGLSSDEILAARELSNGRIWIGTADGYSVYHPATNAIYHFKLPNPNKVKISDFQEMGDAVFLTTLGAGLFKVSREQPGTVLMHYTTKQGLPSNYLLSVKSDKQHDLWLLGEDTISRLPRSGERVEVYPQPLHFNPNSLLATKDDHFYAIGVGGIVAWQPEQVKPELTLMPPMVISSLRVGGHHVSPLAPLKLPYRPDVIDIDFAALDFVRPEQQIFRYRIDGMHDDWILLGHKRSLSFPELSPGRYVVHIQGTNSQGIWSDKEATLTITIAPPWWATWWARMLVGLGLVGLFLGYRRFLIAKTKRLATIREIEREHVTQRQRVGGVIEKEVLQGLEVARNMPLQAHVSSELRRLSYHLREAVAQLRLEDVDTEGLLGALMVYGRQCTRTKVQVYHRGYQNDGLDKYSRYAMAQFFMVAVEYARGEAVEATLICEAQATRLRLTPMELMEDTVWESFTRRVSAYGKAVREGVVLEIILRNATLPEPSPFDHEEDENDGDREG